MRRREIMRFDAYVRARKLSRKRARAMRLAAEIQAGDGTGSGAAAATPAAAVAAAIAAAPARVVCAGGDDEMTGDDDECAIQVARVLDELISDVECHVAVEETVEALVDMTVDVSRAGGAAAGGAGGAVATMTTIDGMPSTVVRDPDDRPMHARSEVRSREMRSRDLADEDSMHARGGEEEEEDAGATSAASSLTCLPSLPPLCDPRRPSSLGGADGANGGANGGESWAAISSGFGGLLEDASLERLLEEARESARADLGGNLADLGGDLGIDDEWAATAANIVGGTRGFGGRGIATRIGVREAWGEAWAVDESNASKALAFSPTPPSSILPPSVSTTAASIDLGIKLKDVLRHRAHSEGLDISAEGWMRVREALKYVNKFDNKYSEHDVRHEVGANAKVGMRIPHHTPSPPLSLSPLSPLSPTLPLGLSSHAKVAIVSTGW